MAYTPQTWVDQNSLYPVSADRMVHLEQGIDGAHDLIEALTTALANKAPNTQVFTGNGTWTKPAGCVTVRVYMINGGDGGGSGRRGSAGSIRCGGGAGAGGARSYAEFVASTLGATVPVFVGLGGAGGAAVTTNDTNGNPGAQGGTSSFGTFLYAYSISAAQGGTDTLGTGSGYQLGTYTSSNGASASSVGGIGETGDYHSAAGGSGGAGGGITAGNVPNDGGAAWGSDEIYPLAVIEGGNVPGEAGADGQGRLAGNALAGSGGGGGAASITTAAGAGGQGGLYGGGGGGGGASLNGFASGAGGNGRGGIVVVVSF